MVQGFSFRAANKILMAWVTINLIFFPVAAAFSPSYPSSESRVLSQSVSRFNEFGRITPVSSRVSSLRPPADYSMIYGEEISRSLKAPLDLGSGNQSALMMLIYAVLVSSLFYISFLSAQNSGANPADYLELDIGKGLVIASFALAVIFGIGAESAAAECSKCPDDLKAIVSCPPEYQKPLKPTVPVSWGQCNPWDNASAEDYCCGLNPNSVDPNKCDMWPEPSDPYNVVPCPTNDQCCAGFIEAYMAPTWTLGRVPWCVNYLDLWKAYPGTYSGSALLKYKVRGCSFTWEVAIVEKERMTDGITKVPESGFTVDWEDPKFTMTEEATYHGVNIMYWNDLPESHSNYLKLCKGELYSVGTFDGNEDMCLAAYGGNKYTEKAVWDGTCCGDDKDDDPDGSQAFCEQCKIIGTYYELQDPSAREWDSSGKCCGDDLRDDCMLTTGSQTCLNTGGILDPDNALTTHPEDDYCFDSTPDSDSWGDSSNPNWCYYGFGTGDKHDTMGPSGYNFIEIERSCTETEGQNFPIDSSRQGFNLSEVEADAPLLSKGTQWEWADHNNNVIYYSTCAGYSFVNGISCNTDFIKSSEKGFWLPYGKGSNANPDGRLLCHSTGTEAAYPYVISECCGTGSCITTGAVSGYHNVTGDMAQQWYEQSNSLLLLRIKNGPYHYEQFRYNELVPGQPWYCNNTPTWAYDLDNQAETCVAAGYNWTGTKCCGEIEDFPEFYNDTLGSCWRSVTVWAGNRTYDIVDGEQENLTELLAISGSLRGCAVDDQNPEVALKANDTLRGWLSNYTYKLQNDAFKEYGGSNSTSIIMNWSLNGSNDWIRLVNNSYTLTNNSWNQPWTGSISKWSGSMLIVDDPYCTVHNISNRTYYCAYNETWVPGNKSHLSFIEWNSTVENAPIASCCPEHYCWNETHCVENDTSSTAVSYPQTESDTMKFICEAGEWVPAERKFTWDNNYQAWAINDNHCLADKYGNFSNSFRPELFSLSVWNNNPNQNPQWINDSQYILDHMCIEGNWTTRTRIIASELLKFIENQAADEYSLYCDSYNMTLNNVLYNLSSYTHNISTCRNLVSGVFPVRDLYLANIAQNMGGCQAHCRDALGVNIPCVNSICVLRFEDEGEEKVIFGASLNQPLDSRQYPFKDIIGISGCTVQDNKKFNSCGSGVWYNKGLNAVIFSKHSFSLDSSIWETMYQRLLGLISRIIVFFGANPISYSQWDYSYINLTRNFDRFYVSEAGGNRVEAILELGMYDIWYDDAQYRWPKDYLYANYTGIGQDVCSSLASLIGENDGWYSQCVQDGNSYILSAIGDYGGQSGSRFTTVQSSLYYWNELTARLRVQE